MLPVNMRVSPIATLRDRAHEIGLKSYSALAGDCEPRVASPEGLEELRIEWPAAYSWEPFAIWLNYLRTGMSALTQVDDATHMRPPTRDCEVIDVRWRGRIYPVVIDCGDTSSIDPALPGRVFLYFKMQFARDGYSHANVVPGGYTPACGAGLYPMLPALRRLRDARRFAHEVHGRFGAAFGYDRRRPYLDALGNDGRFRFTGGFRMLRPSGFLTEVARARVLIDLPGQGDFCFRLVDYLAIGSCIVAARHGNRLPVELVDGRDIVLVDTPAEAADACADLLRNPDRIEELAANARSYFDQHLSRRALAAHYLEQIVSRLMSEGDGWRAA